MTTELTTPGALLPIPRAAGQRRRGCLTVGLSTPQCGAGKTQLQGFGQAEQESIPFYVMGSLFCSNPLYTPNLSSPGTTVTPGPGCGSRDSNAASLKVTEQRLGSIN